MMTFYRLVAVEDFILATPSETKVLKRGEILKVTPSSGEKILQTGKAIRLEEVLKSLYLEAFERMGWICGMGRYEPLAKAEEDLNRVWQDCLEGKATMEDFKATLSRWVKEARKAYGLCRMKAEELKREGRVIEVRSGGGRVIYIAPSRRTMENLRKDGELWFTVDEVKRFKGLSPQEREKILEVKEIFSGWILRVC